MNLNIEKQQELIDEIITIAMLGHAKMGFEYYERKKTNQAIEECEKESEKNKEILINLLNEEGREKLEKLINTLEEIEIIKMENAFNNGVKTAFSELSFLENYFEVL